MVELESIIGESHNIISYDNNRPPRPGGIQRSGKMLARLFTVWNKSGNRSADQPTVYSI